jgi:uncharacterized protein (TIGR02996 family)
LLARNPDLEALLVANYHDNDAWRVYADWLTEHGDPRGELIGLDLSADDDTDNVELGALRDRVAQLVHGAVFGDLWRRIGRASLMTFKRGFAAWIKVDYDCNEPRAQIIADILDHPACALLGGLELGPRTTDTGRDRDLDCTTTIELIAERAPPTLQYFTFRLPSTIANLDAIRELPRITNVSYTLDRYNGPGFAADVVRTLCSTKWPTLRGFGLDLGDDGAMPDDLAPLFQRSDLPLARLSLRGDRRSTFCTAICKLLVDSPLAASLEELSLWVGNLSKANYELLVEHRRYFTRLRKFYVPSRIYTEQLSG